ncbi:MAG: hypothetical protein HY657_00180 [Acidobacteria bacterium]|nr:hypothetical protein [Acidobacteriota bacterium]
MPDPSEIHGRAIPAPELPAGTVTVRVVREALGNNIQGQSVTLTVPGGEPRTATTDDQGRAEFSGLPQIAGARAGANVDGEQLVSEPFSVPPSGGLRVILVAGLAEAAARREAEAAAGAAAPAVSGAVVFGGQSRVLMEFQDDTLHVYYVLEVLNNARTPVEIGGPLVVELPRGAIGAAALEGSAPSTTVGGDRVIVSGPFAPGATSVQVGFRLELDRPTLVLDQQWPAAMEQVTVAVEKVGALALASPQLSSVGEVKSESGTPFLLANGPALPAGGTLRLELSNLPAHGRAPRLVALGVSALILTLGGWLAFSAQARGKEGHRRLVERRDTLLGELAALERRARRNDDRRGGPAGPPEYDAKYAAQRQRMLTELEQIYGELDQTSSGPQGGGEGVAA